MSKGSRPRPFSVSQEEFSKNFDKIFKKSYNDNSKLKDDFDKLVIMKDEYYDVLDTDSALTEKD